MNPNDRTASGSTVKLEVLISNQTQTSVECILKTTSNQLSSSIAKPPQEQIFRCPLLSALALTLIKNSKRFLSSLDTRHSHSTKGRAHAVEAIDLRQLHTTNDKTLGNLTGVLNDSILSQVHVQTTHTTELVDGVHGDKTLSTESTERTVVTGGTDDDGSIDGVGVHAGVVVMVESDESPVHDNTSQADLVAVRTSDQVFNAGGVEELDVREGQDLGEKGGGEQGGVLNNHEVGVVGFILEGNAELGEECIGGTAEDHGGEELATQPGTTTWELLVLVSVCGSLV